MRDSELLDQDKFLNTDEEQTSQNRRVLGRHGRDDFQLQMTEFMWQFDSEQVRMELYNVSWSRLEAESVYIYFILIV